MATISNLGDRDGIEIVQVYASDPAGALPHVPFWKRLVGFARVRVAAGATAEATVPISWEDLAAYAPEEEGKMKVYCGAYVVSVGGDSSGEGALRVEVVVSLDGEGLPATTVAED